VKGKIVQSAPGSVIQVSANIVNKAYLALGNMNLVSELEESMRTKSGNSQRKNTSVFFF
jgi:hypothetical protein